MSDTVVSTEPAGGAADGVQSARWLLLIHQLPPHPAAFRVRIWRRLQGLGAVPLKASVYALPASPDAREDFAWVLQEIVDGGGEAMVCEAALVGGLDDARLRQQFMTAREADYATLIAEARELAAPEMASSQTGSSQAAARSDPRARLTRLKAEAAKIAAIDFFGASGGQTLAALLAATSARLEPAAQGDLRMTGLDPEQLKGSDMGDAPRRVRRPHRLGVADPAIYRSRRDIPLHRSGERGASAR